ncbi:hypothetical protein Patl1_09826 [Pistacia atlantica]|uniref:Uncharacterized protein n=1 Tax=Pistacia atlantica TaxID=434234 RepID=A0ACC1A4K9_9ROSI|nr:hypothetical protein Patl1_09826 [Pistacia atlantica]
MLKSNEHDSLTFTTLPPLFILLHHTLNFPQIYVTNPKITPDSISSSSTMKKLYRKGTVHPSPPIISDHLSFLPATILTLTAALSPEDREVLAYLISCSNHNICVVNNSQSQRKNNNTQKDCECFARWDASPNRQLIHEIIDAFEDDLLRDNKKVKSNKKDKKKKGGGNYNNDNSGELKRPPSSDRQLSLGKDQSAESEYSEETSCKDGEKGFDGHHDEEAEERGSVKRFVRFYRRKDMGCLGIILKLARLKRWV